MCQGTLAVFATFLWVDVYFERFLLVPGFFLKQLRRGRIFVGPQIWKEKERWRPIRSGRVGDGEGQLLGGGFKYFLFSPLFGEDFQFDYCNIFQMG